MNKVYPEAKAALQGLLTDGQVIAVGDFGLGLLLQSRQTKK